MSAPDFDRSLALVLTWEGVTPKNPTGFSDDPKDPGGVTVFGLAQRSHPTVNVRTLTLAQARTIYQAEYWKGSGADGLTWPLCLVHFDCAVNQGVSVAQQILSIAGPAPDVYLALRVGRYWLTTEDRPASKDFLKGWLGRMHNLREAVRA